MKTLCITGHRPQFLYGFDYANPSYTLMRETLETLVAQAYERKFTTFIAGGAQGVDTFFTESALKLRDAHPDVRVVLAVPFVGQESRWTAPAREQYKQHLHRADSIFVVSENKTMTANDVESVAPEPMPHYMAARYMYQRNIWMVDNADAILAVWSGNREGGTYHCLTFALESKKHVVRYNPFSGEIAPMESQVASGPRA